MNEVYQSPLITRYASKTMQEIFSNDRKFRTWRRLWIALAESEKELGLDITDEQIAELRANADDINYDVAEAKEKELRHDVMAHIHAYGEQCPKARAIIHLGATSCFVGDNTDILVMRDALLRVRELLVNAIAKAADFAEKYKSLPTLAFTHFQAAQPTTVGKRATLWLLDLTSDLENLDFALDKLCMLGCKGTTGTAASFLELFDGDVEKVKKLDRAIAEKMGLPRVYPVSGQTYSRKVDYRVLSLLSGIAQSCQKFSNDIRLLSHLKEAEEPFESKQIGSSAMAYKRNPMRSERISSLSRYVMTNALDPALTAGAQWFERTLDDSANKRITVPESFLAVDAILTLYINVIGGLKVYPKMIEKHLSDELPFMATENVLMFCVREKGGDRQELHEAIRRHSIKAAEQVKLFGGQNDLIERIAGDPIFGLSREELESLLDSSKYVGIAREQTDDFLSGIVKPILEANASLLREEDGVRV